MSESQDDVDSCGPSPEPAPQSAGIAVAPQRVLVVDDNPVVLRRVAQILVARRLTVTVARDGLEALRIVQEQPFDLVLADILMPNLSGLELAQWMRRNPRLKSVPILFCSCLPEIAQILQGTQLEGVDYLLKPVDAGELIRKMDSLLAPDSQRLPSPEPSPPEPSHEALVEHQCPTGNATVPATPPDLAHATILPIPTLSEHRRIVLDLFESPKATTHDFARVASMDPGLATTVIRLVNATLQPLGKQVSSIADACVLIGVRNLRGLCLRAALAQERFTETESLIASCWRHSISTAHLASRFASLAAPRSERDVGLAGLLHGIGIIALLASPGHDLPKLIQMSDDEFCDLAVVETVHFGYHHADLAQAMATRWKLRNRICEIIGSLESTSQIAQLDAWCVLMASLAVQVHEPSFVHRAHPEELWQYHGAAHPELFRTLEEQLPWFLKESSPQMEALR